MVLLHLCPFSTDDWSTCTHFLDRMSILYLEVVALMLWSVAQFLNSMIFIRGVDGPKSVTIENKGDPQLLRTRLEKTDELNMGLASRRT